MGVVIKAESLSKVYRLGEIGTGTLSYDFQRWVAKVRGREDPFLKIGELNDRTKGDGGIVYSLKDLNFEVKEGEALAVIGRNGAGKSTLLKVLSRVTSPTEGKVRIRGRIASLLEVGTGFHPELTGKENIYLNGAILGMRKREIDRKLDEIIDFSGVSRYINTPVKRYSSGMYVRLAFAVAAHLESEILIIDEVLAVGDIEFQKKCLGKIGDVSKSEGRTVLFVSHNLSAVKTLCQTGLLLNNGEIAMTGTVNSVIDEYKNLQEKKEKQPYITFSDEDDARIITYLEMDVVGEQPFKTLILNMALNTRNLTSALLVVDIMNSDGMCLFQSISNLGEILTDKKPARNIKVEIDLFGVVVDNYSVNAYICSSIFENLDAVVDRLFFDIIDSPVKEKLNFQYRGTSNGYIYPVTRLKEID